MLWHAYTSLHHSSNQPQICHPAIASACQNILEKCMTQWDALAAHKIVDCICICCCVQPQHSSTWVVNMKVYQKVQCKVMTCPSTDLFHARPCIQLYTAQIMWSAHTETAAKQAQRHTQGQFRRAHLSVQSQIAVHHCLCRTLKVFRGLLTHYVLNVEQYLHAQEGVKGLETRLGSC